MSQSIRYKWCEKEISDIDYIRHLEAENAKLKEPKTCDGCKFLVHFGVKNSNRVVCNHPFACIRRSKNEDYYEPKEQQ